MCKKGLKSHYIVTLQSKNKNNAFKAEVKFKLKMKIIKKHRLKGYFDCPIIVTLQLVLSYKWRVHLQKPINATLKRHASWEEFRQSWLKVIEDG